MDIKINGREKYSLEISLYVLTEGPEYLNEGRKSFQQTLLEQLDIHMQNRELRLVSHTKHVNYLKVNRGPKRKS